MGGYGQLDPTATVQALDGQALWIGGGTNENDFSYIYNDEMHDGSIYYYDGGYENDTNFNVPGVTYLDTDRIIHSVPCDYNGDGHQDVALLYRSPSNGVWIHLITSDENSNSGLLWKWYLNENLSIDNVKFVVPGDFNHDGNDDLALIYRYSNGMRVHLITHPGTTYTWGWSTHIQGGNYLEVNNILHAIPGDFNNDNLDDIALLYSDEGIKVHLITSNLNGTSSYTNEWWHGSGWAASNVAYAVPGNFNNRDNDDIAVIYRYSNNGFRVHLITHSGTTYTWTWANHHLDDGLNKFSSNYEFENNNESMLNDYMLFDNYPNPFNPLTNIKFQIQNSADVKLKIYNILGQEIRTLIDGFHNTGTYEIRWDGRDNLGNTVSSGIYIYQLQAGEFVAVKKMILLK